MKIKKQVEEKLEQLKDNKTFVENITNEKRRITEEIKRIDETINNKMLLQEEYKERNKDLPLEEKIFSLRILSKMMVEERENKIAKEKGAVFISQIGKILASGEKHDGRAPDYDDWELNGDIIVYYPVLDMGLELSSMGIRVDEESLKSQLKIAGCEERAELPFQKSLLNKELPYTVGGGIGQSRICMYYLRKAHIGEVQSSLWPDDVTEEALAHGINLL